MNNQVQTSFTVSEDKKGFLQRDRARLVAELDRERKRTAMAQDELVYSKRFYRAFVGILIALIVVMYGGLWYAKSVLSAACF